MNVCPSFIINSDIPFLERETKLKNFIGKLYPNTSKSPDIDKINDQQAFLITDMLSKIYWYIPTNSLRGLFYYIFKDNFLIYFLKKSSF